MDPDQKKKGVTSLPEVWHTNVDNVDHAVICSDGIWDVFENDKLYELMAATKADKKSPAFAIVDQAKEMPILLRRYTSKKKIEHVYFFDFFLCLEILFCFRGGQIFVITRKRDDGSWGLIPDQNRRIDEVCDDGTITFHHTEEIPVDELVEAFESGVITIDTKTGIITHVNKDVQHFSKSIFKNKFVLYNFLLC